MEDVDFSGLEELFHERFFSLMLRRGKIRPETVERMRSWEHSGFNVDFSRGIKADDRAGLQGLLSYCWLRPQRNSVKTKTPTKFSPSWASTGMRASFAVGTTCPGTGAPSPRTGPSTMASSRSP